MKQLVEPVLDGWSPVDPVSFSVWYGFEIDGLDSWSTRVSSPRGLLLNGASEHIVAQHPLVVMRSWDESVLLDWVRLTVGSCWSTNSAEFATHLRRYFAWEYEYTLEEDRQAMARQARASGSSLAVDPVVRYALEGSTGDSVRAWWPDDPLRVDAWFEVGVLPHRRERALRRYRMRVVTPTALEETEGAEILATRPTVVLPEWSSEAVWSWVSGEVARCGAYARPDFLDLMEIAFDPR